ncbi:hypothetical protein D3C86_2039230 [compost metagenome]
MRAGVMVTALTAMPPTLPTSVISHSVCIWSLFRPSACRKPTVPAASDCTIRISSTDAASRSIMPVLSQRVLSSGAARLCSTSSAAAISTMEPARQ